MTIEYIETSFDGIPCVSAWWESVPSGELTGNGETHEKAKSDLLEKTEAEAKRLREERLIEQAEKLESALLTCGVAIDRTREWAEGAIMLTGAHGFVTKAAPYHTELAVPESSPEVAVLKEALRKSDELLARIAEANTDAEALLVRIQAMTHCDSHNRQSTLGQIHELIRKHRMALDGITDEDIAETEWPKYPEP